MLSIPVPVLSFLFVSFRPSLIRFPQLFLRCFPYALAFGIFRFPSASFRPLLFRFRLLSLCFFLSALPGSASQWLPRCAASPLGSTVFPVRPGLVSHALLPVLVLGLLFVSFRPSRLRSHSCSTGASLLFRFRFSSGLFRLPSAPFRSLRPASDYSAFRLSFPLFPISPDGGSLGALRFLASPLLSSFDSGTQLPAISFLRSLLRVTGTTQPPASCFQLGRPLSFRLRFRLLGFVVLGFGSPQRPDIY